jgi:hypothetical protein
MFKNTKFQDAAWPPTGVRDLKPDSPVGNKAERLRFPTLKEAIKRAKISI